MNMLIPHDDQEELHCENPVALCRLLLGSLVACDTDAKDVLVRVMVAMSEEHQEIVRLILLEKMAMNTTSDSILGASCVMSPPKEPSDDGVSIRALQRENRVLREENVRKCGVACGSVSVTLCYLSSG
jgi:hypothetical protein